MSDQRYEETVPFVIRFEGQYHVRQCTDKLHAEVRAREEFGSRDFDISRVQKS